MSNATDAENVLRSFGEYLDTLTRIGRPAPPKLLMRASHVLLVAKHLGHDPRNLRVRGLPVEPLKDPA